MTLEKKVFHLGTWHDDIITDNVIRNMATLVKEHKGTKVRLSVSKTELVVMQSTIITGKFMTDYLTMENIYFITVNKYHPSCLVVIAKDHPTKYQILAFRCTNGLDAGLFVTFFKDVKRYSSQGQGYNFETKKQHDGVNWTFRSKNQNNNNRQLSAVVDMHSERAKENGDIHIHMNGGSRQDEDGVVRAYFDPIADDSPSDVKTEVTTHAHTVTTGTVVRQESNEEEKLVVHHRHLSDNESEVSETSLRDELDYLSQELRDIKFMLEKSTGRRAEVYQNSPRRTEQPKSEVVVTRRIEQPETKAVVTRDATVIDVRKHSQPNGNTTRYIETSGKVTRIPSPRMEGEVRVSVPDYRGSIGTSKIYTETHTVDHAPAKDDTANYKSWGGDRRSYVRPQSGWRDEVVLRQRVRARSTRPRTTVYSTSGYGSLSGSVRSSRASTGYVLTEYSSKHGKHNTLPANRDGSFKRMHVATTVQKPIERVYGRHSTYGGRPVIADQVHQTPVAVDFNENNVNKSDYDPRQSVVLRT